MKPASFCSMATESCWEELYGLLLSLSFHHPNESVFLIVDTITKTNIERATPRLKLDIRWSVLLDEYTGLDRNKMNAISPTYWTEFQLKKADIMKLALDECPDTLYLDSDMIVLGEINDVDNTKSLGVSPHYINTPSCEACGFFNAGFIWTNTAQVIQDWIKYTKHSRYHEQASIEDLVRNYSYFEFGENYNFSWWRVFQSDDYPQQIMSYLKKNDTTGIINYKGKPLKVIHTHFKQSHSGKDAVVQAFNSLIINFLTSSKANYYKHLIAINKIITVNWILEIPESFYTDNLELYKQIFLGKDVIYRVDKSINAVTLNNVIGLIDLNKLMENEDGEKSWNLAIERILYG